METKKEIIRKVRFTGKWVEIWFKSSNKNDYNDSFKGAYLWEAVEQSNLNNDIMNRGFRNRVLNLKFISPNWEIDSIE